MENKILYVDGDSYTTPNMHVDIKDSYWSLFGNYVKISNIVNYAYPGKSNEGIFRNATRFILDNNDKELFMLLGFTHLERYDVFDREHELRILSGEPVRPLNLNPCEQGVVTKSYTQSSKESDTLVYWHREFDETKFLSNLINFSAFCQQKNVKFMLHYCSKPLVDPKIPLSESFFSEVQRIPNIINLFDNTYQTYNQKLKIKPADYEQYGWNGHHGPAGNKAYFEFLISKYNELYKA